MSDYQSSSKNQPESLASAYIKTLSDTTKSLEIIQENQLGVHKILENLIEKSSSSSSSSYASGNNDSQPSKIDLVEFSGSDRSMWPTWKIQAQGKAISTGLDPMTRFYAVFNKLKDTAAKNVTPWVTRNLQANTATYEGLLEEMERLYGDPASKAKALSNLKVMKQQDRESFANFYPKFERELANAGGASIDDTIKVMFLRSALNSRFRASLPLTKNYSNYDDLVLDLQTASATIANEQALYGRRAIPQIHPQSQQRMPDTQQSIGDVPTPMDWTPTSTNQLRTKNGSSHRPRARLVSKETLQARYDANCCVRCGSSKHYQRNCPYLPPINPNPLHNNNRAVKQIDPAILMAEPEIEDTDASEEVPEN